MTRIGSLTITDAPLSIRSYIGEGCACVGQEYMGTLHTFCYVNLKLLEKIKSIKIHTHTYVEQ